jgi:hypothetical protein
MADNGSCVNYIYLRAQAIPIPSLAVGYTLKWEPWKGSLHT